MSNLQIKTAIGQLGGCQLNYEIRCCDEMYFWLCNQWNTFSCRTMHYVVGVRVGWAVMF